MKKTPTDCTEEEKSKYREEYDRWDKAEEGMKITRKEAQRRVKSLRAELEGLARRMEGIPFDIPDDELHSLHGPGRDGHVEMVEAFNPIVGPIMNMVDDYAKHHGCHENLDFQAKLFAIKMHSSWSGLHIGVLAGAIFAGCAQEVVDRFERGLTLAVQNNGQWVKD